MTRLDRDRRRAARRDLRRPRRAARPGRAGAGGRRRSSRPPAPGGAGLAATLAARDGRGGDAGHRARPTTPAGEELRALLGRASTWSTSACTARRRRRSGCSPAAGPSCASTAAASARGCGPLPAAGALDGADAVLVSDYGRGVAAEPTRPRRARRARRPGRLGPAPAGPEPVPGRDARHAEPARRRRGREPEAGPSRVDSDRARGAGRGRRGARAAPSRWARGRGRRDAAASAARCSSPATGRRSPCPRRACAPATRAAPATAFAADRRGADRRSGALPSEAVRAAVAGGVRVRRAGETRRPRALARRRDRVAERVRAAGGTVVATGGCFDLLHAGHVRMLEQARALGDCLIVCLNSDASVRAPEGRRPAARRRRTTAPRVLSGLGVRRRRRRLRRGRPARGAARRSGPTSGSRAATTPSPSCPRRRRSPSGVGAPSSCPTSRVARPPA